MGPDGDMARSTAKAPVVLEARPVAKHPVLDGVGPLKLDDECYKGMYLSARAKVLTETENPDNDKAVAWLRKGAQPTDTVRQILKKAGILDKVAAPAA